MDTKLLEVFLTVVNAGSISAAARRLDFSQPTVSQQMKSLERLIGVELFTREGGRVELTAAGKTLQAYAESTLSAWHDVRDRVRESARQDEAISLSIGAFPSANAILLPTALGSMVRAEPRLEVRVLDTEPPADFGMLRSGQCDALLTFADQTTTRKGVQDLPVLREQNVLLVPEGHELAGREMVALEESSEEPFVGGCPHCRQELVETCLRRGFHPRIGVSSDDLMLTRALVRQGVGVAMRPALTVLGQPLDGVVAVTIEDAPTREVSIQYLCQEGQPTGSVKSAIETLHRHLLEVAEGIVDEQGWLTAAA